MKLKSVLITTPDYLPNKGGLTTYTLNIEKVLSDIGVNVKLEHWKSIHEIQNIEIKDHYDLIINISFWGGYYLNKKYPNLEHINVIHGTEALFKSPNLIKEIYKKIIKKSVFKFLESSKTNIFISNFTKEKVESLGFKSDCQRDLIFQNCIDTSKRNYFETQIQDSLKFICIARDVAHKNLRGCVSFVEEVQKQANMNCELYLTSDVYHSESIIIKSLVDISDREREELYQKAHFNILLSKDHSQKGFFEGFGLTCLEAGKYGTPSITSNEAGLRDNVHDSISGMKINLKNYRIEIQEMILPLLQNDEYLKLRKKTYDHIHESHGLELYERLFRCLVA